MRILFVSAWFPYPPDNGSRIRTYYLMKALARDHEVHMVSLLQSDSDPANACHLADICQVISLHPSRWFKPGSLSSILGYFSSNPRSVVDTYDSGVRDAVRDAMQSLKPDVVIASTLGVANYVPRAHSAAILLDEHNCEYAVLKRASDGKSGLRRVLSTLGWHKFARWEAHICRGYDCVTVVSERDRELLLRVAPDIGSIHVVPNGVDTSRFDPADRVSEPGYLLYNGALTYGANLEAVRWYASDVYPILSRRHPQVVLNVTGRTDGVDLTGIADCPGVRMVGYLPDIRDALRKSAVCVVPLRQGGGSRLKILEAMAAGVPVVSTSMGMEGIDAEPGRHFLAAETPEEMSDAVSTVIEDSSLASDLSRQARVLVEAAYDWSAIGREFVDVVDSCRMT